MDSCFPVGDAALLHITLHYIYAGLAEPIADNRTLDKGFVTATLQWGRVRPKRPPVIALTLFARCPQEGGSCKEIKQINFSDKNSDR